MAELKNISSFRSSKYKPNSTVNTIRGSGCFIVLIPVYICPNTLISEVQIWAPRHHPAPLAVHEVHKLTSSTQASASWELVWGSKAAVLPESHTILSKKTYSRKSVHLTDRKRVRALRNGFPVNSLHTHNLVLPKRTAVSQLKYKNLPPPNYALYSGFKTITQLFCVRKVSQGGETNGFISHPAI